MFLSSEGFGLHYFDNTLEGVVKMAVSLAKPVDLTKRKVLTPVYTVRVPLNFFQKKG